MESERKIAEDFETWQDNGRMRVRYSTVMKMM